MKVLMLNGSPRPEGNTAIALCEMEQIFQADGVETELIQVGNRDIRGCVACNGCAKLGRCVFDDTVNELAPKFEASDGLVVGSPVYYASANATLVPCSPGCSTVPPSTRPWRWVPAWWWPAGAGCPQPLTS